MKKEYEEIEERFRAFPKLAAYFKEFQKTIDNFDKYEWEKGVTKEKMLEKRDALIQIAENIDALFLITYYYAHEISSLGVFTLRRKLKKLYLAEKEVRRVFEQSGKVEDIMSTPSNRVSALCKKGKKS